MTVRVRLYQFFKINYQKIGEGVAGVIINPQANIVTDNLLSQEGRTISAVQANEWLMDISAISRTNRKYVFIISKNV